MQALRFKRIRPERAPYRRTDVLLASTVRAYDDVVIAPMHGFANAAAYYAATSAGQFLPGIAVPTLMIHAEDDPMVPAFTLKPALENKSPFVHNVWTAEGGHVGFVEGFEEDGWTRNGAIAKALHFFQTGSPDRRL
jgi:predicted alpha/beta-fold hydrolase